MHLLRGRSELPGLVIVLGFFLIPFTVLLLNVYFIPTYFWTTLPVAFLIQGVFIGGVADRAEQTIMGKWAGF